MLLRFNFSFKFLMKLSMRRRRTGYRPGTVTFRLRICDKPCASNIFQILAVLDRKERTKREVMCLSKSTMKRCELFDLLACLRELASGRIMNESSSVHKRLIISYKIHRSLNGGM